MQKTLVQYNMEIAALEYARGMAEAAWYSFARREAEQGGNFAERLAEHQVYIETLIEMKSELVSERSFWHR